MPMTYELSRFSNGIQMWIMCIKSDENTVHDANDYNYYYFAPFAFAKTDGKFNQLGRL